MALLNIEDAISQKQQKTEIAVGIDFGTTNSLCYYFDGELIHEVMDVTPSVVYFDAHGNITTKERAVHCVASIKRHLAKNEQISIAGKNFWAQQIASEVFRNIKKAIDETFTESVTKCVVTVPAYFDDTQRQSVKFAAELAGLEVIRMINEPTAAALYYGIDNRDEGNYIVFDLGGGTFDVSVLQMQKGVVKVVATGGNSTLGGDDFDDALAQSLGVSKGLARVIKEMLTEKSEVSPQDVMTFLEGNPESYDIAKNNGLNDGKDCNNNNSVENTIKTEIAKLPPKITRDAFDEAVLPLIHQCVEVMQAVLRDAEIPQSEIKGLVLVGGSTRMPIVKEALGVEFTVPIFDDADPDRVVAFGGAVQARNIINKGTGNLLLDVIPLSLGIETMGGAVQKVIDRNTSIPIEREVKFTTFKDGQTTIIINVVQGERDLAKDCRSLAKFELSNITPAKAGVAKVVIKFTVDENSILSVSAWEEKENDEQELPNKTEIQVKPTYGIAMEEIRKMLVDAIDHAQEDIEEKLTVDSIVDAQSVIRLIEEALQDEHIAEGDEISQINTVLATLKTAISERKRGDIDDLTKVLDGVSKNFVERRTAWYLNGYVAGKSVDEI